MARGKRRKSNWKIDGPFVPILFSEMDSRAYRKISGSSAKALAYFKRIDGMLRRKSGDDYNGIFDFTYTEAVKYGFAKSTFSRVITDLNGKGFIDIIKQGGKRGCGMSNSKYKLSERWRDYGTSVFMMKPRYSSEPPGKSKVRNGA
jgi:hypothetical protein